MGLIREGAISVDNYPHIRRIVLTLRRDYLWIVFFPFEALFRSCGNRGTYRLTS